MGKKSRRPGRRTRHQREGATADGMRLTVGVAPQAHTDGRTSLQSELQLLRSSLLYADHVELLAPGVTGFSELEKIARISEADPLASIIDLPDVLLARLVDGDFLTESGVSFTQFKAAQREVWKRPSTDSERKQLTDLWRVQIPSLRAEAVAPFREGEADEIVQALESGAVTIVSDGLDVTGPVDDQVVWFRDRLTDAMTRPGSNILLDDVTAAYARELMVDSAPLSDRAAAGAKQSKVGTGLVEHLPAFPRAPMEDILEAREVLSEGRKKYRGAVKNLAAKLASSSLDPELSYEVEELWRDEAQPSLERMRASLKSTKLAYETGKSLVAGGYVASVAVAVLNIPDLLQGMPPEAGPAAVAGRVLSAAAAETIRTRGAVQAHELFYLYQVDRRLRRSAR